MSGIPERSSRLIEHRVAINRLRAAAILPAAVLALWPTVASGVKTLPTARLSQDFGSDSSVGNITTNRIVHQQSVAECEGQATISINLFPGTTTYYQQQPGEKPSDGTVPAILQLTNPFIVSRLKPNVLLPHTRKPSFTDGTYDVVGLNRTNRPQAEAYPVSSTTSFAVSYQCRAIKFRENDAATIDFNKPVVDLGILGLSSSIDFGIIPISGPIAVETIQSTP